VEVASLKSDSIVTSTGAEVPAQLIVWATGHRKTYDWADAATRARLNVQPDGLYLYRNIVPPEVPGLLFIGGEVTTYNNPLTHALQAEWAAALITVRLLAPAASLSLLLGRL
jgi:dimethylaniline monooxygenase (N-oxide forming)